MSLIRLITALFAAPFAALALLMPGMALGANYAASATAFSWVSTTGHTTVALSDDSVSAELALGFTFNFGGVNYTTARVQSNGRLQFNNAATDYSGGTYPGAGVTNTMAVAYFDLNPGNGGSVTYKAIGIAPLRQFVATFTNVPAYSSTSLRFNFQVVVNEDGSFVYQYGAMGSAVYVGYETTVSDYVVVASAYAAPANSALRWGPAPTVISGTVFEDLNYGGGAGRTKAASSGVGVGSATVELYNSSGVFVSATTTNASGAYAFTLATAGSYHLRVASTTVASTRSGTSASLRGVLTYRTTGTSGSAVAVTDFVGGINPSAADPTTASGGATFNTSSYVYSAGLSGTAHAVSAVTATLGTSIAGLDFGFNFDTVTNGNDSGQGSLRQAITNANTLAGDGSLAQSGRTAGVETTIFMISNGTAGGGLRSTLNYTAGGVATIVVASALPSVTSTLRIDATTQPGFNNVTNAPVIEINGAATTAGIAGLVISANNCAIKGLVINRFGGNGIALGAGTSGHVVSGNYIGTNSAGTAAAPNGGHGVSVQSSSSTVGGTATGARNLLSGNSGSGVYVNASSTTVTGNLIGTNAAGTAAIVNQYGVRAVSSTSLLLGGTTAAAANTISGNSSHGVYFETGNSGATVQGNRIGRNVGNSGALGNGGSGVYVLSAGSAGLTGGSVGGTAAGAGNVIAHNAGKGVSLASGSASQVAILGNSIYSNTAQGIDLGDNGISANDGVYSSGRPNILMDFPVITAGGVNPAGTAVTVYGYVGVGTGQALFAGSRIEFFKSEGGAGYGGGQTYLGSLVADASGTFSGRVNFAAGLLVMGDTLTATATDANGNTSEFGPNSTTVTEAALSPGGFNAFEGDTPAGSTSGVIRTRVAGSTSSIDVVALASNGAGLHPGLRGSVALSWVDARVSSGAATGSCRSSWLDLGAAGSAVFNGNARVAVSITPPSSSTRVMRLKMTYSGSSGTVVSCSSDAFAVIPTSFTLAASDADAASAGLARSLSNTAAIGGVVHLAGRPFTVTAQARDAAGQLMTAYDGTPSLAATGCVLPAGCAAATLTAPATPAVAGVMSNNSVNYAEVGALQVQLSDSSYADIDAADTVTSARRISSATLSVGRFVPDNYTATVSTVGILATANGACMASGQGATFLGQGFTWATAPVVTVTARNAAGQVTQFWSAGLMKLTAAMALPTLTTSNAGSATLAPSYGAITVSGLGAGLAQLNASSTDRFLLDLPPGSVQPSVTPSWTWTLALSDTSETGVAGNPSVSTNAQQLGVGFNLGAVFHSGRLNLAPAHGDARSGVRLLMELQRYTAAGWVTVTEDRGCVTVAPASLGVALPQGVFTSAGLCAAAATTSATTQGGRAWIRLPNTPAGAPGRLVHRLAGPAATGNSCAAVGTLRAVVPLALPWLLGGASGAGPAALATWGNPNRDAVLRRETW